MLALAASAQAAQERKVESREGEGAMINLGACKLAFIGPSKNACVANSKLAYGPLQECLAALSFAAAAVVGVNPSFKLLADCQERQRR